MRELKFRAIVKYTFGHGTDNPCSTIESIYYKIYNKPRGCIEWLEIAEKPKECYFQVIAEDLQYIGSKDNTGKEIYEGDISNDGVVIYVVNQDVCTNNGGECNSYTEITGFVVKDKFDNYSILYPEDFEIIGNIHENPELLK